VLLLLLLVLAALRLCLQCEYYIREQVYFLQHEQAQPFDCRAHRCPAPSRREGGQFIPPGKLKEKFLRDEKPYLTFLIQGLSEVDRESMATITGLEKLDLRGNLFQVVSQIEGISFFFFSCSPPFQTAIDNWIILGERTSFHFVPNIHTFFSVIKSYVL
jgi:hypothetical protein